MDEPVGYQRSPELTVNGVSVPLLLAPDSWSDMKTLQRFLRAIAKSNCQLQHHHSVSLRPHALEGILVSQEQKQPFPVESPLAASQNTALPRICRSYALVRPVNSQA